MMWKMFLIVMADSQISCTMHCLLFWFEIVKIFQLAYMLLAYSLAFCFASGLKKKLSFTFVTKLYVLTR